MRKMTFIACAAALLASTCMFTACKKDKVSDELQQSTQEGSYKGEVVKTEFSIALPAQAVGPNRMPGTTVQVSGRSQFQGMTSITLIPFNALAPATIEASSTRLGDNIGLSDIADAAALGTNSNAKVYPNVAIPTSTSSFLFYAESKATGTKFQKGSLTAAGLTSNTPAGISFSLEPIEPTIGEPTGTGTSGEALIAYLNTIADAKDENNVKWEDYTNTESEAMTALFTEFKKWHSLSTTAIQKGLADLYTTLSAVSTTEPVTTLVNHLKTAIDNSTYATVTGTGIDTDPYVVTLKDTPLDLTNFPGEYSLPEGSVRIKYNDTNKEFQPCVESDYTSVNNTPLDKYVYPASLWYFVNSYIKTSNYSQQALYNNTNDWAAILAAHGGEVFVNPSTHAVAIKDPIQYAVARLDVIVKLNATALDDNKQPTANTINCASYPLTAVLVGGQKNVDYKFQPSGANEYTIYDNVMTTAINATTTNAAANSTLVMESEEGSDKDIQIAIELVNASGHDFVGYEGEIIKAGAKFYLPATLKATGTGKTTDTTPNQVFKQDYTTTATLTIKSLKNARNTIPDLRTPQLDLGLSVNLEWTAGNVYSIDIN